MEETRSLISKYFNVTKILMRSNIRFLLFLVLISSSPWLLADQDDPAVAGSMTFKLKCAACHGEDAKGKSEQEADLDTSVPDLTTISKRNNGHFPVTRIHNIIDGREVLKNHGTRAMPTWGDLFLTDTIWEGCSQVDEQIVRGRILELILYLDSIQQ